VKASYWYLFAAAVTQAVSLGVLLFSLLSKKKNPLLTILSVLALEGGTGLLLAAHLRKDMASLCVTADEDDGADEAEVVEEYDVSSCEET
jgi:hypothetical protein